MTAAEKLKHEAESAIKKTGRYIPPYRMAKVVKTAYKAMDVIVQSDIAMTYEEIEVALEIMAMAVRKATGGSDD